MRKAFSEIALMLLFISILVFAFDAQQARATGTIRIRADGSIDPDTALISSVDNVTYTFTGNIYESIVVERSNIIIDGNGYLLQGTGYGNGFYLYGILHGTNNVTIKNTNIEGFYIGVCIDKSPNNSISGNKITNNTYGIYLWNSNYSRIIGNNITQNGWGMMLYPHSWNNIITENNITKHYGDGIRIGESPPTRSSNNTISNNYIAEAGEGVYVGGSPNNTISHNRIVACTSHGIRVDWSSDISILQNNITDNGIPSVSGSGISIWNTTDCLVRKNRIMSNKYGIEIYLTTGISIIQNDVFENYRGIKCFESSNDSVYHNSFVNNTKQVQSDQSTIVWDDGYPSGGNYWGDYPGADEKRGTGQDQLGSDGIGDTPYTINANNEDRFPLMNPWTPIETNVVIIGRNFPVIIVSNTTITRVLATRNRLFFRSSGPTGETGYVTLILPMVNTTEIVVFVDGRRLRPPPFPVINSNTTHYFIYFKFTLSTHDIGVQFAPPPVGGFWVQINKFELLAPWIGLASLATVATASAVYVKRRKKKQN